MWGESPYQRSIARYRNPALPRGILYFYIFLFGKRDLDSTQRQQILEFQAEAPGQVVPLATTIA